MFDAVYVPEAKSPLRRFKKHAEALEFVQEAYKHCKTIAANGAGVELIHACRFSKRRGNGISRKPRSRAARKGLSSVATIKPGKIASEFIKAMAQHRHWSREKKLHPPT